MDDPEQAARWNRDVDRALLQQHLGPTAQALRQRLGEGWTCTVDPPSFDRTATLKHTSPDYSIVLHIASVQQSLLLRLSVWQDFNAGDYFATGRVAAHDDGFDSERVHATARQALADTDRLKAQAAAHAAAQAVLADTLRRLRHENPHGLLAHDHHHLMAKFTADLAEVMAAVRAT